VIDTYLERGHSQRLFNADFWPPNPNVPYERLYISCGDALSADLPELRNRVQQESLPRLVDWIVAILELDLQSPIRREKQWIALLPNRQ
jgi:hypothetical protein